MQHSRRNFLHGGLAAATLIQGVSPRFAVHAAETGTIRIGLVGCGNRGMGAIRDAFAIDPNLKLVAVGDAFPEKAALAVEALSSVEEIASRIDVPPEQIFSGLDAYKNVIDACDVVFLCQTPHFRPMSIRYAVERGKHIFAEKPVAVDGAGVKSVLESARIAKEKRVQIVSGFCFRYDPNIQAMIERIRDGVIGDVIAVRANFLTGAVWTRPRRSGDTEMMYQVRNWYNFAWLSGDFSVEQSVHSLDKSMLVFDDKTPDFAYGVGGRMCRTGEYFPGDLYDSVGNVYEYGADRCVFSFCSQLTGCFHEREEYVMGTKGTAQLMSGRITGENPSMLERLPGDRYKLEHEALFKAVRSGGAIYHNDGESMANSSMMTILGRLATITGRRLSWQEGLDMELPMTPAVYAWDADPPTLPDARGRYKVEVPGVGHVYHEIVR